VRSRGDIWKSVEALALGGALAVGLFLPATLPAQEKNKKAQTQTIDYSKLAWPAPPAPARIRYIGTYSGDDILPKKKRGWLERLAGVPEEGSRSHMLKPYGVAIDSKGRAFVVDTLLRVVFVFDLESKSLEYRGDKPPAAFRTPIGAAIDEKDRLFVSDADLHTITCFSPDGEVLAVFGGDKLERPAGLAVDDPLRRLYVADAKARKVFVFDLDKLEFVRTIGTPMNGDSEQLGAFIAPTNVAVDPDGLLYVVDTFNNKIQVFDTDGEPVRSFGRLAEGAGGFPRPKGIAFDSDGHVYVVDAMKNQFEILTRDGKPLAPVGALGPNPGQFNVPAAIAIDRFNRIFVTDQRNRRVQVFQYVTDGEADREKGKEIKADSQPNPVAQRRPK
jgi:sugar lactone lactonase YvrE